MAKDTVDFDDDDFETLEPLEDDLTNLTVSARQLEIRRRIEDSIEAKRIRDELGFDLY
jgi:hypothetical protein